MESEGSTPPALSPLWDLPHTLLLLAPLFLVPLCKKMGFFQGSSCLHCLTSTRLGLPLGRISRSKEKTVGGAPTHSSARRAPPSQASLGVLAPVLATQLQRLGPRLGQAWEKKRGKPPMNAPPPKATLRFCSLPCPPANIHLSRVPGHERDRIPPSQARSAA